MAALVLGACRKTETNLERGPDPLKPTPNTSLKIEIAGVPQSVQQLFAIVSLQNKAGQAVVTNKKVPLNLKDGGYVTDSIALAAGDYTITKLLVTRTSDTAVYATPKMQSAKQSQVTAPLGTTIAVLSATVNKTPVQALPITANDTPESFGYTSEDFGFVAFINVYVHLAIAVGTVVYDSLPGKLLIDGVDQAGAHWNKEIELEPGLNAVSLPEKYRTYTFSSVKWNTNALRTYPREELHNGTRLQIAGVRGIKKLSEETTFLEAANGLRDDSRTEYSYNGLGKLKETKFFFNEGDKQGLQYGMTNTYIYTGTRLDSIIRNTGDSGFTGTTAFTWTGARLTNVHQISYGNSTGVAFEYGNNQIDAYYLFFNGNTMTYRMNFKNGNLITDVASSSRGGGETGKYEYDNNINPYNQLGLHDIWLSKSSKNNLVKSEKTYAGGFPTSIPYKWEYTYDADGYPSVLWTSYKGYTSGEHLYRIKKVFKYQ